MIGENQTVGSARRREPHMVQPLLRGRKPVRGLDLVLGKSLKEPHTFIGEGGQAQQDRAEKQDGFFHDGSSESPRFESVRRATGGLCKQTLDYKFLYLRGAIFSKLLGRIEARI